MKKILLLVLNVLIFSGLIAQTPRKLLWEFPLPRTHTGILLGNGTQGLMIWGSENQLNVTVGRAGFWDHRGGNDFALRVTYSKLKHYLENNLQDSVKKAFEIPKKEGEKPNFNRPQQIGGGRLEIEFPKGWKLIKGEVILDKAEVQISVSNQGKVQILSIRQSVGEELAWINLPVGLISSKVTLKSAYEFNQEAFTKVGIEKPVKWSCSDGSCGGFTQYLPQDNPLSLGFQKTQSSIFICSALRQSSRETVEEKLKKPNIPYQIQLADVWWKNYWEGVPKVSLPDAQLQEIYDYGLYKQACSTPPQGVACTLQGPFMEEYQIVPWSNDYHFNINAEMIYYPALMSGRFDHFKPLWKMIDSWKSEIQKNGEKFFERKGAMMLPHAVDDKCKVVGNFWTGTIDHACTAWMAQLAWLHYRYGGDKTVLEQTAFPLLVGAFEGYWAMLEEKEGVFHLPVSVSPEFRGSAMNAWGQDASFQLAAIHAICKILPQAAKTLNKPLDARWKEVETKLPPYTLFYEKQPRIALWNGMDLVESHRHHSHLGSIYPFVTINPSDTTHKNIVENSLNTWRFRGAGAWSGWCVPWASILHARTGQTEAAVNWLHYWKDNFTNEGKGTLHNANTRGNSVISHPVWAKNPELPNKEIMQLDAGFGALTAVYELLVQNRLDGIYVFPDLSIYWKNASFQEVWAEGGFKISAKVEGNKVVEVKVKATRNEPLILYHNLGNKFLLNTNPTFGEVLKKDCKVGEEIILKRLDN